jgi:hypothetical protein
MREIMGPSLISSQQSLKILLLPLIEKDAA